MTDTRTVVDQMMDEDPRAIFVFGSNLAGRHGRGAALTAVQRYGAIYGKGEGIQGRSYALPTKDRAIRTLPLERIEHHVERFLEFARQSQDLKFLLTPAGTGLAGYTTAQMAPLFVHVPHNVVVPSTWARIILPLRRDDETVQLSCYIFG